MSFITHTSLGGGTPSGTTTSTYGAITSVASSSLTTVVSYTVPVDNMLLQQIDCSGDNIAQFDVLINASTIGRKRTEFTSLNETFQYAAGSNDGLTLEIGDVITLKVIHFRPSLGAFEGRIQVIAF